MSLTVLPRELAQVGFLPAVGLPSGTDYDQTQLYVCLTKHGTLRLYFLPGRLGQVELSSGDLYNPTIHYVGPLTEAEQLERLVSSLRAA